jgi:two-component system cell cycle sensor histidine kinase/response regulator CckA
MNSLGILNLLAAVLEICVPSYALRLVRRFGVQQAGSFVVIAFASLALLHLVNPIKIGPGQNLALSLVYAGASALLLIGMGHTETLCRERQEAQIGEEKLRLKLDSEARERADGLVKIKQEMAQEIVRLQQQVELLGASERQYRLLFTHHPHPMWIFDLRSGRVLAANLSALKLYGFAQQEFAALTAKDLIARESSATFLNDVAKPCSLLESRGVWRHRRKDRSLVDVEIMAVDLKFGDCPARLMFAEDIGPRLRRESDLSEAAKMRILRRTAEGVAHHFGQIIGVVEGKAGLLLDGLEKADEEEPLQQILSETRRGATLIRQLLAVGGCEGIQSQPVDLNALINGLEAVLRRLIGDRISLELNLAEGLPPALGDSRFLEHSVVNLVLNARDALPHGGSIVIHTDVLWLENQRVPRMPDAQPGQYLRLTVRDNGCGMSAEVQEHLFEPFFTTRDEGKAMGLGLATVYGVVKQHGGWIDFATEPRRGAEFQVFLPAALLKHQLQTVQTPVIPSPRRETILLVEADDQVRNLARHILCRDGYRVIEADTPSTALVLMEGQADNVHLLLTDLDFPNGTSGVDLAHQLRQAHSDLQVVYATGTQAAEEHDTALFQKDKLLFKPYTQDQLLQAISSSLPGKIPLPA